MGNLRVKMIDLNTWDVSFLWGMGCWYPNKIAKQTPFDGVICGDFLGNTYITSCNAASVISKIYQDGIKEDIAGAPEMPNAPGSALVDGIEGTSRCKDVISGAVTNYNNQPYYWFFDGGTLRHIDLNTNITTTFPGIQTGNPEVHLIAYDKYLYYIDLGSTYSLKKYDITTGIVASVQG